MVTRWIINKILLGFLRRSLPFCVRYRALNRRALHLNRQDKGPQKLNQIIIRQLYLKLEMYTVNIHFRSVIKNSVLGTQIEMQYLFLKTLLWNHVERIRRCIPWKHSYLIPFLIGFTLFKNGIKSGWGNWVLWSS